jgi:hypothetical protein
MATQAVTLRALADRLDIIAVCTRYHWCVDHRDWGGLGDLLADYVSFPTPAEMSAPGFDPADYRRSRADITAAYPGLLGGVVTQHLVAGHQVELDGDRAVCLAHAINVHQPADQPGGQVVMHGNEYRFELERGGAGWRICARQQWIRWRAGDEAHYDVDARTRDWAGRVRPSA